MQWNSGRANLGPWATLEPSGTPCRLPKARYQKEERERAKFRHHCFKIIADHWPSARKLNKNHQIISDQFFNVFHRFLLGKETMIATGTCDKSPSKDVKNRIASRGLPVVNRVFHNQQQSAKGRVNYEKLMLHNFRWACMSTPDK